MNRKVKKIFLVIVGIIFLLMTMVVIRYGVIIKEYHSLKIHKEYNWSITPPPFYSGTETVDFLVNGKELDLALWWESLSGTMEITITDIKGNICYCEKSGKMDSEFSLNLEEGQYQLAVQAADFTGAVFLGYGNIVRVTELPDDNYFVINSKPDKGFYWDYILFIPNEVTENHLLVSPNNSGFVSDSMNFHNEMAKELILFKSPLAEELGVPLLVPVFPRPESQSSLYTHALDRGTLLTNMKEYARLDLQLIAMIDDAKAILAERGIIFENQLLMSGFSAAGDFTDRFTFLHPDIVKAAMIGGCSNMIPYSVLDNENLPYPIGIYDYKDITGKAFDREAFAIVSRYLYKGSEDEGGWITCEENGEVSAYTGKEYYEKIERNQLIASQNQLAVPVYTGEEIKEAEISQIMFRIYKGEILVNRFLMIEKIYNELGLKNNQFVIYQELGHEINDVILQDELNFFKSVLEE